MSRIIEEMRKARREGRLPEQVRAADFKMACPGWAERTYGVFLPKH